MNSEESYADYVWREADENAPSKCIHPIYGKVYKDNSQIQHIIGFKFCPTCGVKL